MTDVIRLLLLVFLGCSLGCETSSPQPLPHFGQLYLIDDFSTTNAHYQHLSLKQVENVITTAQDYNWELLLLAGHVSQPSNDPVTLKMEGFYGDLDPFQLDYPKQKAEKKRRDSLQLLRNNAFVEDFSQTFEQFDFDQNGDYSYVSKRMNALSQFFRKSALPGTERIGVICTDFKDSTPAAKPSKLISDSILQRLLNSVALDDKNTLYVITETQLPGLENPGKQVILVSSWTEAIEQLNIHFSHLNHSNYVTQN